MIDGLRTARVVRYYPESHSADIVHEDNGWRAPRVPILCPFATNDSGIFGVPTPTEVLSESDLAKPLERILVAVVGYIQGHPVIIGFLSPDRRETAFTDADFYVHRYASDAYLTNDAAGNTEFYHPSGTYLRIAEDPDHRDLTGIDFNKRWELRRNKSRAPHVRLVVARGGDETCTVNITPEGNVSLETKGTIQIRADGAIDASTGADMTLKAEGDIFLTAGGNVEANVSGSLTARHDGPTTIKSDGPLTIQAPTMDCQASEISLQGNVIVTGALTVSDLIATPVDVVARNVSLTTHLHTGVKGGGDTSGPPA